MIANCHPLLWVSQTQYQTFLFSRGLSLLLISNLMLVNRSGWMIALAPQWLSRNFRGKKNPDLSFLLHSQTSSSFSSACSCRAGTLVKVRRGGLWAVSPGFIGLRVAFPT